MVRILFRLLLVTLVISQQLGHLQATESSQESTWGIIPVVVPLYAPETGWKVTGGGIWWYNPGNQSEYQRLSEVMTFFSASEQGQYGLGLYMDLYFYNNKIKVSHKTEAAYEPYLFWGTGDSSLASSQEEILPRTLHTRTSILYLVFPNIYFGPLLFSSHQQILSYEANGSVSSCGFSNCNQTDAIGPGLRLLYDTRDNPFYPRKGTWVDASWWFAVQSGGGSADFSQLEIDARRYYSLSQQVILGLNAYSVLSSNQPGLAAMPRLGGQFKLRGYYEGRYIDKNLVVVQAELRFPIWWRFGGVLFAGVGDVGSSLPTFSKPKAAAGFGLRVLLDKADYLNLRLDFGINRDNDQSGYFTFKEAF